MGVIRKHQRSDLKIPTEFSENSKGVIRTKNKGVIRRHQRGDQRLQRWKLENIEGVIRRYQQQTKGVNGRTDNAMSNSLEMSKGKSIMVKQIEYIQFNGLKKRNKQ